jgi:putative transposase
MGLISCDRIRPARINQLSLLIDDTQLSLRLSRMGFAMDGPTKVHRTYRFRIYPTRRQGLALEAQLEFARNLYNAALEQRRYAWRAGRRIGYITQCRELTDLRAAGDGPPRMSCSAMRSPLRRLERAYQAFFRRVKAHEKPGYPRFRSRRRYHSLTWDSAWSIRDRRLALLGIGHVRVKWHRDLPGSAKVRNVTVRRSVGHWYACFALELNAPAVPIQRFEPAVGIDLGVQNFAALSTGELIPGPRAYRAASRCLRVAQRRVSRRVKGSRRRGKAGLLLARLHQRIRNVRRNHAHQTSRRLVIDFGLIAVEDLQLRALTRGFLAKDINDQGWAEFLWLLGCKAEDAGTQVVRVPPGGSSQGCSGCGISVPKTLSERTHRCPNCGLVVDRDVNAARNILRLGLSRQAITWPTGACVA